MAKKAIHILLIGMGIGVILFIFEQLLRAISGNAMMWDSNLMVILGLYMLYSVPLSFVNAFFFDVLNERVDWKSKEKHRVLFGFLGSVALTLFTLFLIRIVHRVLIMDVSLETFFKTENLQFYFTALIITVVISLFFHAFYMYRELQNKKVNEQKIIAGTASAKFESLKSQIDPHFLFNSLNVLTSLIEEDAAVAQKFTTSLSKVYRYVLEQKDKELVPVQEELNFAKTYMELLKIRFENSLTFEVPQQVSHPEAKVVPLALQLLLENCVKHNVASEHRPLHIKIYEEDRFLVIENNLQKKEILSSRRGVGLKNIKNRYDIITNRQVLIEEEKDVFRIKLPVLTKQLNSMETKDFNENNAYFKAKERVKEMKEFYGNLISYCVVIPFLIFVNYYTYWDFQWFWFPLFGWGLGVIIHGFSVFGYGSRWEERKIRQIMEKENENAKKWQ